MTVLELQCRPIEQWPGKLTVGRKRSTFTAPYGQTLRLLERELQLLGAKGVCLLMAVREQDIRLDGRPRANAQPQHPGVILTFTTKHGAMQFPCDTFTRWDENLRAIALALEHLRAVDRYGVTKRGEQYKGWQALPSPTGDHWDAEAAARWLADYVCRKRGWAADAARQLAIDLRHHAGTCEQVIREAVMLAHPDKGGDAADFHKVQQANLILRKHHGQDPA